MLWGCPPRQRRMVARQSRFVEEPVLVARVQTHARGGFVATTANASAVCDDRSEKRLSLAVIYNVGHLLSRKVLLSFRSNVYRLGCTVVAIST